MLTWLRKRTSGTATSTTCTVSFADGRAPLDVPRESFLLAAALDAGMPWPHNCKVGTCGRCKTRIVSGRVKPAMDFALSPLTAEELREGYVLACQSRVREDLLVDVPLPTKAHAIVRREAEVTQAAHLTADVLRLHLALDAPLVFSAGQFVDLSMCGFEAVRSYSICEAPRSDGLRELSFLIRQLPGGYFSERLFRDAAPGLRMQLHGPFGMPTSLVAPGADVIGVAGGTGLAPMLSLLEDRLSNSARGHFTLLLGLRSSRDDFAAPLLAPLLQRHGDRIDVQTWLSNEPAGSDWSGPRGLVTDGLTPQWLAQVRPAGAFLCGAAAMVDAARDRLVAFGLPSDLIHADAFAPSGTVQSEAMA